MKAVEMAVGMASSLAFEAGRVARTISPLHR